jgi:hypothetical protein
MSIVRKKPVEVEAWKCSDIIAAFSRDYWAGLPKVIEQEQDRNGYWLITTKHADCGEGIHLRTLEGVMIARPDDWIIRGVQGEFYPCKPDIFEATYDVVTP